MKNISKKWKITGIIAALVIVIAVGLVIFSVKKNSSKYEDLSNWSVYPENITCDTDTFFIAPTAVGGDIYNMDISDEKNRNSFTGATKMEMGIYDDVTNFYAPFYRQGALRIYDLDEEKREQYLEIAYKDVEDAFNYYIKKINTSRPIVLAGFSQGGDMVMRLLMKHPEITDRLVAAYVIGWNVTDEELAKYPQLKMAKGEDDIGVIVSFCSESEDITSSIIVPDTTNGINPLNWKTDGTVADKSLNLGACFTNYDGEIVDEIPNLCGAYIDENRGTLKVLDVTKEEYPGVLSFLEDGNYHLYDYQFFYRNLEKNVSDRVAAYH